MAAASPRGFFPKRHVPWESLPCEQSRVAFKKRDVEKMVSNHGWSEAHTRGMHTVKETDMQAAKLDLLLKRMDDREISTKSRYVQALDWHQRCRFEWVNPLTRYPNYKE
jgi:NADH pyrophosphatase NudC (nudix superfamily)